MPHPSHFQPLPPVGALLWGLVSPVSEVTFYPELRWNGVPVYAKSWHLDSAEPILLVGMDRSTMGQEVRRSGVSAPEEIIRAVQAYVEWLKSCGWDCSNAREECTTFMHVDDLEKIEGAVPFDVPLP